MERRLRTLGLTCCLLAWAGVAVQAQPVEVEAAGRVSDAESDPVAGARVVYRIAGATDVRLSRPTDARGEYTVALPAGSECYPVAVILAGGQRIALPELSPVRVAHGIRQEIRIDVAEARRGTAALQGFPGSDRLFQSFVEDTAMVGRLRGEAQLASSQLADADVLVSRAVVAVQFDAIPRVEFGARSGLGGIDFAAGGDAGGPLDTDLWAKLDLGARGARMIDLSAGVLVTLPTGDEDAGLGADATRSKLFGAARLTFARLALAGHLGVRFNGDGEILGVPLEGRIAPAGGLAVIRPLSDRMTLVGEATFEGEAFEGGDPDARLLAGLSWRVVARGALRFSVSAGLTDGAPDSELGAGFAVQF